MLMSVSCSTATPLKQEEPYLVIIAQAKYGYMEAVSIIMSTAVTLWLAKLLIPLIIHCIPIIQSTWETPYKKGPVYG